MSDRQTSDEKWAAGQSPLSVSEADLPERPTPSSLAVVFAISQAERRQHDHRHTATRRKKAIAYVSAGVLLPLLVGMVWGAYRFGQMVETGELDGLVHLARWYLPVLITIYALSSMLDVSKRLQDIERGALLRTAVRDRDIVFGLVLADLRESAWYLFGPAVILVLAFAAGAGSVLLAVVGTAAAIVLMLAGMLVGYAVGVGGRIIITRVGLSGRLQSALGGVGSVAAFLVFAAVGAFVGHTGARLDLGETSPAQLAPSGPPLPIGHYADFFFVGTPLVDGLSSLAIASGVAIAATIPVSTWATATLTPRLWRLERTTDSKQPDRSIDDGQKREGPWLDYRWGHVADGLVRRTIRQPRRILHVVYYVIGAGYIATSAAIIEPTLLPTGIGAALVVFGIWLAGGAVCLNPLGEEGSMLDQLVLADYSASSFLQARLVVGSAIGLALVIPGTVLLAVRPLTPLEAVAVGATLAIMVPVSSAIALGVGTLLPKTEPGRLLGKFDARPPERLAILVHGALSTALMAGAVALIIAPPSDPIRWGGLAVIALATAIAADGSYRFAVRSFSEYGRPTQPDPIYALELAVGLALVGMVLSNSFELTAAIVVPFSGLSAFTIIFVAAFAGWALAGVAYLLASGRTWSYIDVRRPTASDGRYLVLGLVASLTVYAAFIGIVVAFDLPTSTQTLTDEFVGGGLSWFLALAVLVMLVNAPVEEFLFRNVIQKRLADAIAERWAILAVAVIFAAVHIPVYFDPNPGAVAVTITPLAVVALVWGWLYARTSNLVVPALCHGLYNVVVFGVVILPAL